MGPIPQEWVNWPSPTPELGRVAATWAAGQAAERNQWALELWRATEEKRAALVALRQSEETLHQVWRQLRPPWPAPPTAVPPDNPPSGRASESTAMGNKTARRHGHREQVGGQVTTTLREGKDPGASRPQAEPPAEEGASHLGRQRWSHSGQDGRVGRGRRSEEGESKTSRMRPPLPAGGEQWQVDIPARVTTPGRGQHGVDGCTGPEGSGQPRGEGPCQAGGVKREEPEGPAPPQAGEPGGPRKIK